MNSPDGFDARRPTTDDTTEILRLTYDCDVVVLGFGDWSADEVLEQLESPRSPAATHHWVVTDPTDDGAIVGWGSTADETGGAIDLDWYVQPTMTRDRYDAVTHWLVDAMAGDVDERARGAGLTSVRLETGAYRAHTDRAAELAALGFASERTFFRMARAVDPDEIFPAPAPGVVVRPGAETEHDRRVMFDVLETAFADHFNHHARTFDEWWTDQRGHAGLDLGHWRIAELDGVPAGACTVTDRYLEQNAGYIGSLGVLRESRGHGVAKALLAEAFAFYRDAGRARVFLHVDSESPTGATRLYESLGMTQDLAIDFFAADHTVPTEPDRRTR